MIKCLNNKKLHDRIPKVFGRDDKNGTLLPSEIQIDSGALGYSPDSMHLLQPD